MRTVTVNLPDTIPTTPTQGSVKTLTVTIPQGKAPRARPATPKNPPSSISSPVSVVWYIVASNPTLPRCDLVRVCEGVGVNPATARTQVQAALKSYRANGYPAIPQGEGTATTQDTEASGITPKDDPTQVPTEENTKP